MELAKPKKETRGTEKAKGVKLILNLRSRSQNPTPKMSVIFQCSNKPRAADELMVRCNLTFYINHLCSVLTDTGVGPDQKGPDN